MINKRIRDNYISRTRDRINLENLIRANMSSLLYNNLDLFSFFNFLTLDSIKILIILEYLCNSKRNKLLKKDDLSHIFSNFLIDEKFSKLEFNLIINDSLEKAFIKFKSPIITSDILLFSFLSKNICIEKENYRLNIITYKLLQKIYNFNVKLRMVNKNSRIFIYLLISQISEAEFEQLFLTKKIDLVIFIFRNLIFNEIKKLDTKQNNNKQLNKLLVKRKY
jgi:hypothetical protein